MVQKAALYFLVTLSGIIVGVVICIIIFWLLKTLLGIKFINTFPYIKITLKENVHLVPESHYLNKKWQNKDLLKAEKGKLEKKGTILQTVDENKEVGVSNENNPQDQIILPSSSPQATDLYDWNYIDEYDYSNIIVLDKNPRLAFSYSPTQIVILNPSEDDTSEILEET